MPLRVRRGELDETLEPSSDLARANRIEIRAEKVRTRGAETDLSDGDGFVTVFHPRGHKRRDSLRKSSGIAVALPLERTTTRANMAIFRHPHLLRGIVHTSHGAFVIVRGLVDLPDEIGEALRWARAEEGSSSTAVVAGETLPTPTTAMDQRDAD